jgi:hypothetical protein
VLLVAHEIALLVNVELSSPDQGIGPRSLIYAGIHNP